jgi:predicted transcriptional regulator with HTH domain
MEISGETDEAVIKSLRRSKVRIIVLLFIAHSYAQQANLKELCNRLNICKANILGSLIGSDGRYRYKDSLVGLELLERIESDLDGFKMIHYRITEKGTRIVKVLENEPMINTMLGELRALQ